jgi:hypothetical protein
MAFIASVNVGRPRTVDWRGKSIETGIFKQPIAGRISVHRTNIEGDGQADLVGHGGEQRAVFVYQLDLPLLGSPSRSRAVPAGNVWREPHDRRSARRRSLHRRSLPRGNGGVRGEPATRHLL